MFDFVARHKKLIQVLMFLMFIPFAFFGVDVYFRGADGGRTVARVGDYAISQEEFSRALRDRQQALQNMMQGRVDPALLDTPEMRQATLETLIQKRLLLEQALRSRMTVSDTQLKALINEQQSFRDESGKFSFSRYEQFLKSEGMTPAAFETRLRHDMLLQQFNDGYADSSFVPRAVTERLARLSAQQREISYFVIAPQRYLSQVKLDPASAKKHYDASPDEFRVPEQVRVEYVTLSIESLMQQVQIDPAELRKYYDANLRQFGVAETRQAGHILITADAASGADAKQKAQARAQDLYEQIRKKPESFADLARKHSQDPGSAAKGGDLGFIGRGTMKDAPEFESALYQLKTGGVSPPVETRHGFHIIRLIALQPAETKPFEDVRGQIEKELKQQQAARRYAELADNFNNVVYEQSESLKPVAALLKSAPQQSGWIARGQAAAPFNHPKLLAALFSDDALKNKRNTEAVEVAPGTLISARVLEHKAASLQPFDEARAALEKKLALREATRLAAEEGRRMLDELKQGKSATIAWSAPQLVAREGSKEIPEPIVRQAFRMDSAKLPVYAGLDSPQGSYVLLRVGRVVESEKLAPEKARELAEQLRTVQGQEALAAYVTSLRQQAGVEISKEALEKKQ